MQRVINDFFKYCTLYQIDIYNEFSLQFELAYFLRTERTGYTVKFEKNIKSEHIEKVEGLKSEIDLLITKGKKKFVIELKTSIGQERKARPITVFNWIKDLCFLKIMRQHNYRCYSVFLTNDEKFITHSNRKTGDLLADFRLQRIGGKVYYQSQKDKKNNKLKLDSIYSWRWKDTMKGFKYVVIEVE